MEPTSLGSPTAQVDATQRLEVRPGVQPDGEEVQGLGVIADRCLTIFVHQRRQSSIPASGRSRDSQLSGQLPARDTPRSLGDSTSDPRTRVPGQRVTACSRNGPTVGEREIAAPTRFDRSCRPSSTSATESGARCARCAAVGTSTRQPHGTTWGPMVGPVLPQQAGRHRDAVGHPLEAGARDEPCRPPRTHVPRRTRPDRGPPGARSLVIRVHGTLRRPMRCGIAGSHGRVAPYGGVAHRSGPAVRLPGPERATVVSGAHGTGANQRLLSVGPETNRRSPGERPACFT